MSKRISGVLAHPTSFPSAFGIGDLGQGAYDFVRFLHESGQRLWQVLPLGPTSYGDSPYQSFSTFAGNPLLISPEKLLEQGYLTEEDLESIPEFDPRRVDYGRVIEYKDSLYRKAFARADVAMDGVAFRKFCKSNAEWLDDFTLFMACKHHLIETRRLEPSEDSEELAAYRERNIDVMSEELIKDCYYGAAWSSWPAGLKSRDSRTLNEWATLLQPEIQYLKFLQFLFFGQWKELRDYANGLDIQIVGDIPIFVALDSADVWANRGGFLLCEEGYPLVVAGVPPDYFTETGQLWGNPIYDWAAHERTGFKWWTARIKSSLEMYDIVRIDHFRGFDEYWEVPYGEKTAMNGKWKKGPGKALFSALSRELNDMPIIAEDLGVMTPTVEKLRDQLGFPGMKILQFAFDDTPDNVSLPHNYGTTNLVVYPGTHDNDTSAGWYAAADAEVQDRFRRYLQVSGRDAAWDMIRLAFSTTADYAIVSLQDVMSLGSADRMNLPGTAAGNWKFRYTADMLREDMSEGLKYLSGMYNRNAKDMHLSAKPPII
ncbi:MAG: 4-alpha-glucanotransferase [Defluviitaleaceae bacterium]|nr:4-alpha-glucanotransferase [Defluviitaleaceae bacterium]